MLATRGTVETQLDGSVTKREPLTMDTSHDEYACAVESARS